MKVSPMFLARPETTVQRIAHFAMLTGCAVLCLGLSTTAAVRVTALPATSKRVVITYVPAAAPASTPIAAPAAQDDSTELLKPVAKLPAPKAKTFASAASHQSRSTVR